MQTFLPYRSFRRSAAVLDDRRLGKQRVETLQLLNALRGWTAGWKNHPAACMWRGYEDALVLYGLAMTREWKRRGYADTVEEKLQAFVPAGWRRPRRMPPWLGDPALHLSHRAALLRKDPARYAAFFPGVSVEAPIVWPPGQLVDDEESMPEGHTLHRLARDLRAAFRGRLVAASSPQGRFAEGAARLDGQVLLDAQAVGKHLFVDWQLGDVLHVHLGKQGTVFWRFAPVPPPVPPVRLRLRTPDAACDLVAPRLCALVTPEERRSILSNLGVDPLSADPDPQAAWERIRRRRVPIGALLLDQAVLAGVGNVFRAEALHVAGVHPATSGSVLSRADFDRIWAAILPMMREAVEAGSIRPGGRAVYRQERCGRCGEPVEIEEIGGRTSYACPRCQPRVQAGATRVPAGV